MDSKYDIGVMDVRRNTISHRNILQDEIKKLKRELKNKDL
jgi:hypothetical protein